MLLHFFLWGSNTDIGCLDSNKPFDRLTWCSLNPVKREQYCEVNVAESTVTLRSWPMSRPQTQGLSWKQAEGLCLVISFLVTEAEGRESMPIMLVHNEVQVAGCPMMG